MPKGLLHCSDGRVIRYFGSALICALSALFFFWQGLRTYLTGNNFDALGRELIMLLLSMIAGVFVTGALLLFHEGRQGCRSRDQARRRP